ncbi:MAG: TIGR02680 family protein [Rhodospirillaceae bacterium]|nr:TIGR02680 family protein [Rhodospirillaceae bacterium]
MQSKAPARWQLNRAGIINVYQYENEILQFADGRLLLRGVNGSGKSTAMNMLLPFLLTAHQGRIDAAGEQSRILKTWMLGGRDDPQPVGYLWIEFQRQDEFLVCGCGIKANRQSDTVTTWWFLTSKRPGFDFELVDHNVPLSAESLRATLDGDDVFGHHRRADYRRTVEHALFNGAPIDQHVKLINVVRHPRVGDRIDVDLANHLVDALPQLTDQAVTQAAQPLDDLDEHRRTVAELAKTLDAVTGLLTVYRSYCTHDLALRIEDGRDTVATHRKNVRDEKRKQQALKATDTKVLRLETKLVELEEIIDGLHVRIHALEESRAYQEGRQLDPLREYVAELAQQGIDAARRVEAAERRTNDSEKELIRDRDRSRRDIELLNECLTTATELAIRCRLSRRPPGLAHLAESPLRDSDATAPGTLDANAIDREFSASTSAVEQRRLNIDEIKAAFAALNNAERELERAESEHNLRLASVKQLTNRLAERNRLLKSARQRWYEDIRQWTSTLYPLMLEAHLEAPAIAALTASDFGESLTATDDHQRIRATLRSEVDLLVERSQQDVNAVNVRLSDEKRIRDEAQRLVDELQNRTEPEPPQLDWQTVANYCLADVVDFAPHLSKSHRLGLEAALQASGLLSARLADGGMLELANGDLVATVAETVRHPLSECLVVTVPDRLAANVSETSVAKLLDSISLDMSSDAATAVGVDGTFRVGALRGRHRKERAEFVGATARRSALAHARQEARIRLQFTEDAVAKSQAELGVHSKSLAEAREQWTRLPTANSIDTALAHVRASNEDLEKAKSESKASAELLATAERVLNDADNALQKAATTLDLPRDRERLANLVRDLDELALTLANGRSLTKVIRRSVDAWRDSVEHWQTANRNLDAERAAWKEIQSKHEQQEMRLRTIQDRIGAEYAHVVAERDRRKADLTEAKTQVAAKRKQHNAALIKRAKAEAEAQAATSKRSQADHTCEDARLSLEAVLQMPGYLDAVKIDTDSGAPDDPIVPHTTGYDGLNQLLDTIDQLLASHSATAATGATNSDSVRQSLRQRRDALGAGWDAEALQPNSTHPLIVEVTGPSGRTSLTDCARALEEQHRQMTSLLSRKQADALRELLQGMIAEEIATKVHGAKHLVALMNRRLGAVTTAHNVGVQLRWRRRRDLDPAVARLLELLATVPDVRTDDDERELRQALSYRLDNARAEQPDVPYRQLIAETLDYKQWYEMAVMLRRTGPRLTKLGRNTPLSEGEKKLVTYLPLFAAVAASYDSLAERRITPDGDEPPGIARFILLDDAFAKVSEDNHAALFGLLVELDLDLIATSERLWGTHRSVPALAITEIIRDAALGAILLEHYRWDGASRQRVTAN